MAFEQFLTQKKDASRSKRWRSVTYSFSLLLHGALLLGMIARSFWHVEELQPPAVHVTLSALRPPPPPPPPAAAPKAEAPEVKPKVAVRPRPAPQIVQPVAPTETPPAEATASNGEGEPGGVEGGVAGGVATAAPPPPPPPPKRVEPVAILLPPSVGSGQRLSDLNDPRFRPSLPPQLKRAGMIVWGLYKILRGRRRARRQRQGAQVGRQPRRRSLGRSHPELGVQALLDRGAGGALLPPHAHRSPGHPVTAEAGLAPAS